MTRRTTIAIEVSDDGIQTRLSLENVTSMLSIAKALFEWCHANPDDNKERREKASQVNDIHCLLCLGLETASLAKDSTEMTLNKLFMDVLERRREIDDMLASEITGMINDEYRRLGDAV